MVQSAAKRESLHDGAPSDRVHPRPVACAMKGKCTNQRRAPPTYTLAALGRPNKQ